jgi:hypothetical protein
MNEDYSHIFIYNQIDSYREGNSNIQHINFVHVWENIQGRHVAPPWYIVLTPN